LQLACIYVYIGLFVCLPICVSTCISQKLRPNFAKFSLHIACGRGTGPSLTSVQYIMYFQLCGWRHVFL